MLSLCMIVRDEEAALPRCLKSVADLVDEIVVVDTGSSDGTVEVAGQWKATVLHHDFSVVDFAAARNAGLAHARGHHILVLDADETLAAPSAAVVRDLSAAGPSDAPIGYVVSRRNIPMESSRAPWTDHAVRLFTAHPLLRYSGRVHETIDDSLLATGGTLRQCDVELHHFLPAADQARAKGLRYLDLLRAENPDDPDRLTFLAAEYHKLEQYPEATKVAERIAELAPDDFTAQFTAALYHHFYAGDPDRARADVDAALRIRPDDPEALELRTAIQGTSRGAERLQFPQTSRPIADRSG